MEIRSGIWHGIEPVSSGVRDPVPIHLINNRVGDNPSLLSVLVATSLQNVMSPRIFPGFNNDLVSPS